MNVKEIQELVRQVVENNLSELEYEESGVRIKIKRNTASFSHPQHAQTEAHSASSIAVESKANVPPHEPAQATVIAGEELHIVTSPLVGTFYRASNPKAEPIVEIGDIVEEGSVLCIIEAMKLMNEIRSDVGGEIINIFPENGQPVEYGQQLFAIHKK